MCNLANECLLKSLHALVFKCATVLNHLGRDPSHTNGSAMHALHFLFQNMVQSANKGNLVHLRNENFLGAFIWCPGMIKLGKIVKLMLFSPSVKFPFKRCKKMCRNSRIGTCTPTVSNRRLQVYVPYRHSGALQIYQLSYVDDVVVLELHKWEPYPNHHWKCFQQKPALGIVNCPLGQWTDISSSFYLNLPIHLRCLFQVGGAYWIHLSRTGFLRSARWPLLHPISTQTICSETESWF